MGRQELEAAGYNELQIYQIIKGEQDNLHTEIYTDLKYDFMQMEQIRKGLEENIDVSQYANEKYSYLIMRQIRKGLEDGISIVNYANEVNDGGVLKEIRNSIMSEVDIIPYVKEGYDREQLYEIRGALEKEVDIKKYINLGMCGAQIYEIRVGLENRVDVTEYADDEYSWQQMQQIRLGLEENLDISKYKKKIATWKQMRQIRMGLEQQLDIDKYSSLIHSAEEMRKIREQLYVNKNRNKDEKMIKNLGMWDLYEQLSEINDDNNIKEHNDENILSKIGEVTVQEDKMQASIKLNKPENDVLYSVDDLLKLLSDNGVKAGIDKNELKKIIDEQLYDNEIVIAKGKNCVDGKDGYYELYFETNLPTSPRKNDDGSMNYQDMRLFIIVEKDQLVANYRPVASGIFGFRVDGSMIIPKKGVDTPPLAGTGIYLSKDRKTIFASYAGKVSLTEENTIEVSPTFVVNGDVDARTGDIKFRGDVLIRGNVQSGYSVNAVGNISIDGYAEDVELISGKNIVVKKGMDGKGNGRVKANGSIYGSYFENTVVSADGSINANYVKNSELTAAEYITMNGCNGKIVGGKAYAVMGITTGDVGDESGADTIVQAGVSEDLYMQCKKLMNMKEELEHEKNILKINAEQLKQNGSSDSSDIKESLEQMEEAVRMKISELENVSVQLEKIENKIKEANSSTITVNGIVNKGARIIVNQVENVVSEILENVCFSNKTDKQIEIQNI